MALPDDGRSYAGLGPKALLTRALGAASAYTFGTFGVRAVEFLLLPVYWALLPPEQYGVLAVATVVSEFLRAVFGFGLPEAISRFYWEWEPEERPWRLGAIWAVAWLGSLLLALGLLAGSGAIFGRFFTQVPVDPYLRLAILVALTSSMVQVPLMVLRIMERPRPYIAGTAASTVLGAGLAIYLIAVLDRGAAGVLEAQALAYGTVALAYAAVMIRWIRPNLRIGLLPEVLRFSLPLVPSKVIEATATVVDRFVLEKHISLDRLGIYQAARQLGRGVEMFGYSLLTAWIPFQVRVLAEREEDGRAVVARVAPWFLFAILVASVGLSTMAPPLIELLNITEYLPVMPLVPIAVLPAAILSLAHVVIQGYILAKKTEYAWMRSGARLVAAVVAMVVLVPRFGVVGAFAAMAVAALANGAVGYGLSQRFFPIPFPWREIWTMTLGAVAVIAVAVAVAPASPRLALAWGTVLTGAYAGGVGRFTLRGRDGTGGDESDSGPSGTGAGDEADPGGPA